MFTRDTAHGCHGARRRLLGLRVGGAWYVQELNGYRVPRLKRRGRGPAAHVLVRDARGVMLTCGVFGGQPRCATTTSGLRPAAHRRWLRREARARRRAAAGHTATGDVPR